MKHSHTEDKDVSPKGYIKAAADKLYKWWDGMSTMSQQLVTWSGILFCLAGCVLARAELRPFYAGAVGAILCLACVILLVSGSAIIASAIWYLYTKCNR